MRWNKTPSVLAFSFDNSVQNRFLVDGIPPFPSRCLHTLLLLHSLLELVSNVASLGCAAAGGVRRREGAPWYSYGGGIPRSWCDVIRSLCFCPLLAHFALQLAGRTTRPRTALEDR